MIRKKNNNSYSEACKFIRLVNDLYRTPSIDNKISFLKDIKNYIKNHENKYINNVRIDMNADFRVFSNDIIYFMYEVTDFVKIYKGEYFIPAAKNYFKEILNDIECYGWEIVCSADYFHSKTIKTKESEQIKNIVYQVVEDSPEYSYRHGIFSTKEKAIEKLKELEKLENGYLVSIDEDDEIYTSSISWIGDDYFIFKCVDEDDVPFYKIDFYIVEEVVE